MKVLLLLAAAVAVAVAAGWYGGPLVHPTSDSTSAAREAQRPSTAAIGPIAMSSAQFKATALSLAEPMFWAGPANGVRYEFLRTSSDRLYVRYLPLSVRAGAPGAHFLIVATYPFPEAYKALRRIARGRGIAGPGGSFIYPRPNDPRSVLLAFPRVPYEIEVYDPRPGRAAAVAESGRIRPVD